MGKAEPRDAIRESPMQEFIESKVSLPGVSVLIGTSQWTSPENWVCPSSNYVVCQRLSEGHSPLQLNIDKAGLREVYARVRSLGFMPSNGSITLHPLGHPLRTLNCFFDKGYFESATEIEADRWLELAGSFMSVTNRHLETMMHRIHHELIQPGFGSEQVIEAASTMIAVEMARLGQKHSGRAGTWETPAAGLAPWQLRRIRERLQASFELGYPGIQELAELCGVSRGHLMRMFKLTTGQSLHRFVTEERLMAARQLLSEDRLSIKEVAAALGFCNAGHFTNAFQREERMTPSEFRNRTRAAASEAARRHGQRPKDMGSALH